MKKKNLSLDFIWKLRLKSIAEGNKLWIEGEKLREEGYQFKTKGNKLTAESYKLWVRGDKLIADGYQLRALGDKLWVDAILEVYGNITLDWKRVEGKKDCKCILETGEVFNPLI